MKRWPSKWMLRAATLVAAQCLVASAYAQGIVGSPIDLTASVHEATLPGGTIFDDAKSVLGASIEPTDPTQSAEYLYLASKGQNLSGRSTNIVRAFASSLAESNGNGGVGVTSWIAGDAGDPGQSTVNQLVSQAMWMQTFTYNGSVDASIRLSLHIPALAVGLIGVAPNRDSVSATETAQAEATLESTITHPDGSSTPGASFEFGLQALERQIPTGSGVFLNFADVQFLGASNSQLFASFKDNGDQFNPRFTIDSVLTQVVLGTLQPGDTVSYVYKLIAQGTTHGGEHGYVAFLGDPFGVEVITGNLVASAPEPAAWLLGLASLCVIAGVTRTRRLRRLSPR
jgi:hypothetical protein